MLGPLRAGSLHISAPCIGSQLTPSRHLPTLSSSVRIQRRALSLAYALHEPPASRPLDPAQRPIIILHGLFGSKQNSRSISKAIARDLGTKVYALDLRNHGDSPHDPNHNYTAMAADVEEFLQAHDIPQTTLIGHSMGAKVAMALALGSPAKVGALIPVDNAPADIALHSDFARYVQGMRMVEQAGVKKQAEADRILEDFESSLAVRQFLLTNLVRDPKTGTQHFKIPLSILGPALNHMGDFPFKDPHATRYDGPTLVIRGTNSPYVPDEILPLIGEFFPRFEVRDINCGHWVISEKPEEFRAAVVDFLRPSD